MSAGSHRSQRMALGHLDLELQVVLLALGVKN